MFERNVWVVKYKLHTKERLVYYYIKVQKIYNDKIMKSFLLS